MKDCPTQLRAERHLHGPMASCQQELSALGTRPWDWHPVLQPPCRTPWDPGPCSCHCPPRRLPLLGIPPRLPREAGAE